MLFNSFEFLWMFPIIFCVYYAITYRNKLSKIYPRIGNFILLAISYLLYIKWNPPYVLILLWVTAVTYFGALATVKGDKYRNKKFLAFFVITLTALPLIIFKYYNFFNSSLTELLKCVGVGTGLPGLNIAMPIGVSFFTLQSVGYFSDVYLRRIEAERNWWDYMLFVSFFPQIASGPISKARDLLPQIKSNRQFNYNQAVSGLRWILWGMFLKVVLADRIGITIDSFNGTLATESGLMNLLVAILYSFQIYGDFAGYSFMAVGVGELLGFELINNFRQPYLSQSVTEFWHRWHISLSTWLKDYIYIPLGGSRCSKIRNYFNIMMTFLVSGLWHGANWTFIIWGALHGVFQVVEKFLGLNKKNSIGPVKSIRILITFIFVTFAWIFFRQPDISSACLQIYNIFTNHDLTIHFSIESIIFISLALVLLIANDLMAEFKIRRLSRYRFLRWSVYMIILSLILLNGIFDNSQFIYINF